MEAEPNGRAIPRGRHTRVRGDFSLKNQKPVLSKLPSVSAYCKEGTLTLHTEVGKKARVFEVLLFHLRTLNYKIIKEST